jgi:hypothetical protein
MPGSHRSLACVSRDEALVPTEELMPATIVHRIYTEDKNKRGILRLAFTRFESFTVQPTDSYYRGKRERSMVLEILDARPRQSEELAEQIRRITGQKSVPILTTHGAAKASRR